MRLVQYRSTFRGMCGFTLIELVITVAILGVLATLILPLAQVSAQRSKEEDLRVALRQIRAALDSYKDAVDQGRVKKSIDESGYPPSLEALVEGVEDIKSPSKNTIYFLRRIPRDPFVADPSLPPEESWGFRSYDSPPDDPRAGKDVYDVYSLNPGTGLNGIPYSEW